MKMSETMYYTRFQKILNKTQIKDEQLNAYFDEINKLIEYIFIYFYFLI